MSKKLRGLWIWGIFFGVSLFLIHISIRIYFGDEVLYYAHMMDNKSFWEFANERYHVWTSRIIIETILVYMSNRYLLWKICNVLMYVLWVYSLCKITKNYSGIIMGLAMLYPIIDMSTAGWIATSLNYFWPLVLGTYSFVAVEKIVSGEHVGTFEIVLSIIAEIVAVNVEQYVVLHMLCLGIILLYLLIKKDYTKYKYAIIAIHFLISFASFLFIVSSPGNDARRLQETQNRMPDFDNLSVLDKVIHGYNATVNGFLSQMCLLFLLFLFIIFACVVKRASEDSNKNWIISISAIPVVLAVIASVGNLFRNGYFTEVSDVLSQGEIINAANWNKPVHYIVFILYAFFTIAVVFSIVYIFDDVLTGSIHGLLFICAVLVRMVMGFSPTLYASGQRTFCFTYGVILYILVAILKETKLLFSAQARKRFEGFVFGMGCVFVIEMVTCICGKY